MGSESAGLVVELDESACWGLLRSAEVGRLAIVVSHRPEIFPINLVCHGNNGNSNASSASAKPHIVRVEPDQVTGRRFRVADRPARHPVHEG